MPLVYGLRRPVTLGQRTSELSPKIVQRVLATSVLPEWGAYVVTRRRKALVAAHRRPPVILPLAVVLSLFGTWTLSSSGTFDFLVDNRNQQRGEPALLARIVTPGNLSSKSLRKVFKYALSVVLVIGEITYKSSRRLSSRKNEGNPSD